MKIEAAITILEDEKRRLEQEGDPVEWPSALELAKATGMAVGVMKNSIPISFIEEEIACLESLDDGCFAGIVTATLREMLEIWRCKSNG